MHKRYQVFVSSTFEDLKEARQEVIQALLKLRCFPAVMEFFVASNSDQWSLIQQVIDESDYYVVIVAGKYGSTVKTGPDKGMSYTEMEYRYAREKGIPVHGFVHKAPEALPQSQNETTPKLRQRLQSFRDLVKADKVVNFWETKEELRAQVGEAISTAIRNEERVGWVRGDQALNQSQVQKFLQMQDELDRLRLQTSKISPEDAVKSISELARRILKASLDPAQVGSIHFRTDGTSIEFLKMSGFPLSRHKFATPNQQASARHAVKTLLELGLWELLGEFGNGYCAYAATAPAFDLPSAVLDSIPAE